MPDKKLGSVPEDAENWHPESAEPSVPEINESQIQQDIREILVVYNKGTGRIGEAHWSVAVFDREGNRVCTAGSLFSSQEEGAQAYHEILDKIRKGVPNARGDYRYFVRLNDDSSKQMVMQGDI